MTDTMLEFQRLSRQAWEAAIAATVGPVAPDRAEWSELLDIDAVLRPFLAGGISHAHLPYRGTLQFSSATPSTIEGGCLEIGLDAKSLVVFRPKTLRLEHVADAPAESFILIECADLKPVIGGSPTGIEEVCDLRDGDYIERHHWDSQTYEAQDEEEGTITRPLPEDAKLVRRILRGTVMLVCKGSRWNCSLQTGTGEHAGLDADRIREIIAAMGKGANFTL